jgi:3-deoxy-7-phosphoheptulonate synthase
VVIPNSVRALRAVAVRRSSAEHRPYPYSFQAQQERTTQMMIVMKPTATEQEVQTVIDRVRSVGARAHVINGDELTVIGAIGDREHVARLELAGTPGVDRVLPILKPYKLASSQIKHGQRSVLEIGGRKVGGPHFAMIAGPCTVESREQTLDTARAVHDAGATLFRGGAYKPRTSPYAFQGLGQEGLRLLAEAKAQTGLPIVTEVMDARDLEPVLEVADVVQIGARNMQNYALLSEVGRSGCPALLKRGFSNTLEELLMAAEYILKEGNEAVMLCERGIRTFETAYRFTLDLMAVPVLQQMTHLPVIVDPSHAAGRRDLVLPMSLAAAAAGADGIIVEVHPRPDEAICDAAQQLPADEFAEFVQRVAAAAAVAGKALWQQDLITTDALS